MLENNLLSFFSPPNPRTSTATPGRGFPAKAISTTKVRRISIPSPAQPAVEQASNGLENVAMEVKMTTIRKAFNWCPGTQEVTLSAQVSQLLISRVTGQVLYENFRCPVTALIRT